MSSFLEALDPRGIEVICHKENWEGHITKNHPMLKGHEQDVAKSIAEPMAIYQDTKDVDCQVYYRPSSLPPPDNRGYIRTVVRFRGTPGKERGVVKASYIVAGLKRGETTILWP